MAQHINARRHLVTDEEFAAMMEAQRGVCRICAQPETQVNGRNGKVKPLAVDHDHKTNLVRGLLCHRCNVGLGYFKDSPELLEAAAEYIWDHEGKRGDFEREHDVDTASHQTRILADQIIAECVHLPTRNARLSAMVDAAAALPQRSEDEKSSVLRAGEWCEVHASPFMQGPDACFNQHRILPRNAA